MAKIEGVTRMTINRWVRKGRYEKVRQTKGGHWRIWVQDPKITVNYVREESFEGLKAILERLVSGTPIEIVVTSQDDFEGFGYELIKWIAELHGGEVRILEDRNKAK